MPKESWALIEYDRIVADAGDDGLCVKEAREHLATAYVDAVTDGAIDPEERDDYRDGKALFDRVVRPERERRREHIIDDMEYILAAKDNETFLGRDDPVFGQAHKLGTVNGVDKILGLWTVEDWQQAAFARYDNAAKVTAAAAQFKEKMQQMIERMQRGNARTTQEMWPDEDG